MVSVVKSLYVLLRIFTLHLYLAAFLLNILNKFQFSISFAWQRLICWRWQRANQRQLLGFDPTLVLAEMKTSNTIVHMKVMEYGVVRNSHLVAWMQLILIYS